MIQDGQEHMLHETARDHYCHYNSYKSVLTNLSLLRLPLKKIRKNIHREKRADSTEKAPKLAKHSIAVVYKLWPRGWMWSFVGFYLALEAHFPPVVSNSGT